MFILVYAEPLGLSKCDFFPQLGKMKMKKIIKKIQEMWLFLERKKHSTKFVFSTSNKGKMLFFSSW